VGTDAAEAMQVLTAKLDVQDVYEPWSSVLGLPQNCDPADENYIQIHVAKLYLISDLHGPFFVGLSKCWKENVITVMAASTKYMDQ